MRALAAFALASLYSVRRKRVPKEEVSARAAPAGRNAPALGPMRYHAAHDRPEIDSIAL